jgi:hypothetical protein
MNTFENLRQNSEQNLEGSLEQKATEFLETQMPNSYP